MLPKLYADLAGWYTVLTPPADYVEEAVWYGDLLRRHARREVRSVLELGCGSGANASHMKAWFEEMVLVDLSPQMLVECAKVNPELERLEGDLRTFRDPRRFDAVFVHDAASYLRTLDDLRAAAQTAAAHLAPGGVALFCPDDTREGFAPGHDEGGSDAPDGRGVRYLAWSVAGEDDDTVVTDYVYMLRDADGALRVERDQHLTGRLPQAAWREALEEAGLVDVVVTPLVHPEVEPDRHHSFVAVAPEDLQRG